jgi:hypothetical protein
MIESHMNGVSASPSAGPDAVPEGIYARALSRPSTLSEGKTRAPARELGGGGGGSIPGSRQRRAGREKRSIATRAGLRTATSTIFCFPKPRQFFEALKSSNLEARQ